MLFEVDGGHLENQNGTIIRRRNVEECETTIRRQGWAHPELHDQEHHHHQGEEGSVIYECHHTVSSFCKHGDVLVPITSS